MSELIGTARVELTLDSTQFQASAEKSKNAAHGMGVEAERAFTGLEGRAKRAATSILQYANSYGQAAEQTRLNNAALRGAPLEIVEAVKNKILEQNKAQQLAAQSARELAAAETARAQRAATHLSFLENLNAGVRRMQQDMARAAVDASNKEKAAGDALIVSLQRQAQAIGKTRAELLELQAAELGVAKAAAPFIAQLKAQEAQLHKSGIEFNKYGLSVKQTQAALRQVPAQLTDIFVSLQGGQNPLTVFLQQGGQLRDVFGGAAPALRAMGAQLLSMVNIWTVAAAAIAGVGLAWYKADEEQRKLADGLLLTGNRVGMTTEQLTAMSEELDNLAGTSRREAAAAMAEILTIGQFTGEQFAIVTESALKMENATGKAISETAAEFAKLRKDPVAAIIELADKYGYLDQALIDNVRELERNGQAVEAQTAAMKGHADNIADITPQIIENMGFIRGMFHEIANGAGEALDGVANFFNYLDGAMGSEFRQLMTLFGGDIKKPSDGAKDPLRSGTITGRDSTNPELTAEQAAAQERYRALESQFDESLRRQREIQKVYAEGAAAGLKLVEIEELVMKVQARHAEQDANKAKKSSGQALENAELRSGLQEYKDILAQQQNAIQNDSRVLQAEYGARIIDAETYYARQRALTVQDQEAQEAALTGQIAFLRSRDVAGKEAVDVQRQLGELEAKLAQVRDDGATKLRVLGIEETATAAARKLAIDSYADTLDRTNETLERQVNAEIAAIGVGARVAEQQRAIADAYVERDERLRELQDRLARKDIDAFEYNADVAALREATDEKVRIITEGFRRMDEARASWQNGMQAGIQNWLDAATDVATQVQQIWERSLDRTADAVSEFAEKGRLEWRSFLTDILKMLLDFYAKQAVLQFAQMFIGMFTGSNTATSNADAYANSGLNWSLGKSAPAPTIGAKAYAEPAMAAMSSAQAKSSGPVMLSVSTTIHNDGTATTETRSSGEEAALYREFSDSVRNEVFKVVEKESRPGGKLWRAGVQR